VESADDLICALDAGGRIQAMNRSWTRMTDQPAEKAVGKSIWEIIEFNDPERVREAISRVLETDRPVAREETARIGDRLYDLDTKYTKVTGTDPPDASTVLVIARDITEHKRIEGQLFNAQKLASLGELSAGVAHEINNPIAIILGFTEMLLEKTTAGSKEEKILKAIERQGNNCKRIVENLLAFARIPGQEAASADLASSLRKVVDVVRNTLLTEKVDLDVELPDGLPEVTGSSQELEQVFLNIINNAVAAMEGGGLLRISAGRRGDFIQVDFRDTGPGIPAEIRDKIFEPFFTTKKVGEGTGLGLSVSYGIVNKFGGEIRVESRTDHPAGETGATFSVLLPIAPVETAAEASAVTA
jgi:PAS domain S-box-containing protein